MSLRTRLLLAIGLVSVVALTAADLATYSALRSSLYGRVDASLTQSHGLFQTLAGQGRLAQACTVAQGSVGRGGESGAGGSGAGPGGGGGQPGGNAFGHLPPPTALSTEFAEVRTPGGSTVGAQVCPVSVNNRADGPALPHHLGGISVTSTTGSGFGSAPPGGTPIYFDAASTTAGGPEFRVQVSNLGDGDLLVLAVPLGPTDATLSQLVWIELAVTGGAMVVALLAGWWLVRLGLRPLTDVEATAEAIAAGRLEERVKSADPRTEVGRLGRAFNVMLERIQAAFAERLATEQRLVASESRLRRFVGDASHELRTPIAAVSAYAELFDRGASEHPEDLARLLRGIRHETARMEQLVGDLLTLARLDEGAVPADHRVELVGLCAQAVQTAATVGPQWPVELRASQPVEVMGNAGALRQVLDNLLGNIRAHTPAGTTGAVAVAVDADQAVVTVSDRGPGMAPEDAAHAFERFYRADASRSRAHGGAGLGLSIVAGITASHGGTVTARSTAGEGTSFELRLPLAPLPDSPPDGPLASPSTHPRADQIPATIRPGG